MAEMRRSVALAEQPCFPSGMPQRNYIISSNILDIHFVFNILCDLNFPFGRSFMTDLRRYAIEALESLAIFALFFITSIVADCLCRIWPQSNIMVIIKIVAWIISALGAICCIGLVVRNTIVFLTYLIKGPPRETSIPGEGGSE